MGVSTDGQISFGISFPEEYTFPWSDDRWGGDENEWWIVGVRRYKPPFQLYDESGEYIDGVKPSEEKISEFYRHKRDFKKENPMPVEIVRHCSYDYPMYIIAAPGTHIKNSRGYPEIFEPEKMSVTKKQIDDVIEFCEKYCAPKDKYDEFPEMKPHWYLTSMWG